ncbi:hypothetical protein HYC85_013888, partial [Camellia sinensis]
GPKDLPIIARTAGKLAGRAIGYVQLARGQFNTIMHQTQARQVHKELQDTIAQLEAIRHEIRTVSFMNPSPLTRRLVDNLDQTSAASGNNEPEKPDTANRSTTPDAKNYGSTNLGFSDMQSQATAYAKLAESTAINSGSAENNAEGSDIMLEAILEAEVAPYSLVPFVWSLWTVSICKWNPFCRRIRDFLRVSDIFNRTHLRFGASFAIPTFLGFVPLVFLLISVPFHIPAFPAIFDLLRS